MSIKVHGDDAGISRARQGIWYEERFSTSREHDGPAHVDAEYSVPRCYIPHREAAGWSWHPKLLICRQRREEERRHMLRIVELSRDQDVLLS